MATRRYSLNPGDADFQVTEAVGAATATKSIELTVDLAVVTKELDVQDALRLFQNYITKGVWPPA